MTWDAYEDECKYREGHSEDSEDSKGELGDYHDADRPPLTRWQDVFQTVRAGSRAERTELALVHDQNPAPAVAKLFATVHALQMPAEENAKTRHRCILFSSVKCLGGQHPHPEAHCTFHVGGHSCYSNDRPYLNAGELTALARHPQFELVVWPFRPSPSRRSASAPGPIRHHAYMAPRPNTPAARPRPGAKIPFPDYIPTPGHLASRASGERRLATPRQRAPILS